MTSTELRKKVADYVQAAYLHGLMTENLDTGELEPPADISDTDWITDSIMHAVKDHVVYVIGPDAPINAKFKWNGSQERKIGKNIEKAEQRNRAGAY